MEEIFPFLVMLWNEALSKHSINMGLHAGGSLGLLGWPDMVQGGCQNPPTGNSFSGCVFVVLLLFLL